MAFFLCLWRTLCSCCLVASMENEIFATTYHFPYLVGRLFLFRGDRYPQQTQGAYQETPNIGVYPIFPSVVYRKHSCSTIGVVWQLLIRSCVVGTSLEVCGMDHASSTTSLHSTSQSHIVSKRNQGFFLLFLGVWDKWRIKEQWSEAAMDLCCTLALRNKLFQFELATILSSLTRVLCAPNLPLHQVKLEPLKPRLRKSHASRAFLTACIWSALFSAPLHFSSRWVISLKSPKTIHGRLSCVFKCSKSFQDICLVEHPGVHRNRSLATSGLFHGQRWSRQHGSLSTCGLLRYFLLFIARQVLHFYHH